MRDIVEIVQGIAAIGAVLVGGVWTCLALVRKRHPHDGRIEPLGKLEENASMELIDVLGKLSRPVDTACNLIEALLGESFKVAGDTLADHMRLRQWMNRLRIVDRVEEIMRQRGTHRRVVDPGFLLPFIRDCGDASAESLQEAWARLLSAAVEDELNEHIAFVHVLRDLTASDVRVANCLIELGYMEREHRVPAISDHLDLPHDRVQLSMYNLERLGFFTPTQRRLKGFAVQFLRVCVADNEALEKYLDGEKAGKGAIVFD